MNVFLYKIKMYQTRILSVKMENGALTDFEQLRGKRSVSNILLKNKNWLNKDK